MDEIQKHIYHLKENPEEVDFISEKDPIIFRDALFQVYLEEPCRVLPNAIWKTLAEIDKFETSCTVENSVVRRLELWDEEGLHLYWSRNKQPPNIPETRLRHLKFMLIHQDYLRAVPIELFATRKPYFRLIHKNQATPTVKLPVGFRIADVNIDKEADEVAELIVKCYDDLHPSRQSVRDWSKRPVFDRNLWIWVIDEGRDVPAGLGIAEVDSSIPEASLEWIQVLPEYRGKGLGECIVLELLNRLDDRVEFTTVSGEVESQTNPEYLYRRCDFRGDDVWWILRS